MKRTLIMMLCFLTLVIVIIRDKTTKSETSDVISRRIVETGNDSRYSVYLPTIDDPEIDSYIEQEVMGIFRKLKEQYQQTDAKITIRYQAYIDDYAISYLFSCSVFEEGKTNRMIRRTFNFDQKLHQMLVINESMLQDVYLRLINQKLGLNTFNLNVNDLKMIKYLIREDQIKFMIPSEISSQRDIEIMIPNRGDEKIAIQSSRSQEEKKLAALTFDDGPSVKTGELLDLLQKYHVKATFFLLGERAERYPEEVLDIYRNNHEIGNHSYSHPDFKTLSLPDLFREINTTQNLIFEITHSYPRLFRFPYGSYHRAQLDYIDYPVILWSVDSEDWRYYDNDVIFNNIVRDLTDSSVILFHDTRSYRRDAIERAIVYLKNEGYEFVTVSELFQFYQEENIVFGKIYG